jgi:phosphoribosylglycinamide formyltransferase-1
MKNIVILISGRGSNMQAIVEAQLPGARIAAVIANRPDAAGLAWAAERGIATAALDHKAFASREDFDAALAAQIDAFAPDLVVLAGFMRILTPGFTQHYAGRMFNIHPSLLPAFPGLHTHQRALDAGCRLAGATVHFVTAELDHGPIVAQGVVAVADDDTADSLAAKVLRVEHQIYPQAVRWFVEGRLTLAGQRVRVDGGSADEKSAIFGKYKGRINNFLSKEGLTKPKAP